MAVAYFCCLKYSARMVSLGVSPPSATESKFLHTPVLGAIRPVSSAALLGEHTLAPLWWSRPTKLR